MPDIKPNIDLAQVLSLLNEQFARPVSLLAPIHEGLIARTFSFRVDGQDYIIRFKTDAASAQIGKEVFAQKHFESEQIPIPRILCSGRFHDLRFAISERVPGKSLRVVTRTEYEQLIPSLIETLDALRQVNVQNQPNYGDFDENGVGLFPSWRDYILFIREEEEPEKFFGRWHKLFQDSFLERELFDSIFQKLQHWLGYCPNDHSLVHGGFGFGNVIVQDGKITGVIDWDDAKFGDFLYDVAWLDYFDSAHHFSERLREYYDKVGLAISFYEERIRCYQCYIGLDGLRFFAKAGNRNAYEWTRQRVSSVMG